MKVAPPAIDPVSLSYLQAYDSYDNNYYYYPPYSLSAVSSFSSTHSSSSSTPSQPSTSTSSPSRTRTKNQGLIISPDQSDYSCFLANQIVALDCEMVGVGPGGK